MPFGVTPVLDTFDRADGSIGSNWSQVDTSGSLPEIISNEAYKNAGSFADGCWNVESFGPDSEAYVTVTALPASGTCWVYARLQDTGGSGIVDGYEVEVSKTAGTFIIWRGENNSWAAVATITRAFAAGDSFGISVTGQGGEVIVRAWHKMGGGPWQEVGSYADTAANRVVSAGRVGFGCGNDSTWRLENFGGGTISRELRFRNDRHPKPRLRSA